jgi:putative flippase GtrA
VAEVRTLQFFRYLIAGGINTAVGYGIFLLLFSVLGMNPQWANAISYGIALLVAFFLNKKFVFHGGALTGDLIARFLLSFILAFALNQVVLVFGYKILTLDARLAQMIAMISYTISFYCLNKFFVFGVRGAYRE